MFELSDTISQCNTCLDCPLGVAIGFAGLALQLQAKSPSTQIQMPPKVDLDFCVPYCYISQRPACVCVATVRILGTELAELPLVATMEGSRRKGHARAFMTTLEQMLKTLGVSVICLPAETVSNVSFYLRYSMSAPAHNVGPWEYLWGTNCVHCVQGTTVN